MQSVLIRRCWCALCRTGLPDLFSDELFTKLLFWSYLGKWLNLNSPKDFNEKLQWLKLYYRNPHVVEYADKYAVRAMVTERLGNAYMTKCLGVFDSVEEIDFDKLPQKFVLKATHASGWNVICRDKSRLDWNRTCKKLRKWLKGDFSKVGREWQYRKIKPRIICEEYIVEMDLGKFIDYRLFTFYGETKFILVEFARQTDGGWDVAKERVGGSKPNLREGITRYTNFYSPDWEIYKGVTVGPTLSDGTLIEKPECLNDMIVAARKLAGEFPFCRVDFYVLDGKKAMFSELTFTPAKGCYLFNSQEFANEMGACMTLPGFRAMEGR